MPEPANDPKPEPLPLSLLNDYLFCSRRAALKTTEGQRGQNEHTVLGDIAHRHADLPGYELAGGVTLLRAVPVYSSRLGLSGRCDIVERHADGSLLPVEYKKGPRRRFDNDDAQLCAQALCLEEMFETQIPAGAVFHATSHRRRPVAFTAALRATTESAIADLHALAASHAIPTAILKPACEHCSLHAICLPEITSLPPRLATAARDLYTP